MKFFAIYECTLCKKKFRISDNPFELDRNNGPELIAKVIQNQTMLGNPYLYEAPMHIPHDCSNGGIGIAQLVGFLPYTRDTSDTKNNKSKKLNPLVAFRQGR